MRGRGREDGGSAVVFLFLFLILICYLLGGIARSTEVQGKNVLLISFLAFLCFYHWEFEISSIVISSWFCLFSFSDFVLSLSASMSLERTVSWYLECKINSSHGSFKTEQDVSIHSRLKRESLSY